MEASLAAVATDIGPWPPVDKGRPDIARGDRISAMSRSFPPFTPGRQAGQRPTRPSGRALRRPPRAGHCPQLQKAAGIRRHGPKQRSKCDRPGQYPRANAFESSVQHCSPERPASTPGSARPELHRPRYRAGTTKPRHLPNFDMISSTARPKRHLEPLGPGESAGKFENNQQRRGRIVHLTETYGPDCFSKSEQYKKKACNCRVVSKKMPNSTGLIPSVLRYTGCKNGSAN